MEKKLLHKTEWLSLYDTEGYVYCHETRANGKLVAVLIVDSSRPGMVLGRYEKCPPHDDDIELCSLTGCVEGDDPVATAVMEVDEEAGYNIEPSELVELGTLRPAKNCDTKMFLYAVDVNGKDSHEAKGDGTKWEETSHTNWVSLKDAIECKDPLMGVMIARHFITR